MEGTDAADAVDWHAANAQIIHWLVATVDIPTALSLRRFRTAHEMWSYICTTYSQNTASHQFEMEGEIARLAQGDRDVRVYYQECLHLWTEYDLLTVPLVPDVAAVAVQAERDRTRVLQFLAKLRPEFEPIRASLIHRNTTSVDSVVAELMREETRLRSQSQIDHATPHAEPAFAVGRPAAVSRPSSGRPTSAASTGTVTCFFCQETGHVQTYCIFCKSSGHIVSECPTLRRRGKLRPVPSFGSSTSRAVAYPVTAESSASLTRDQVNQMVQDALRDALSSAFSTGLPSGKSLRWMLDSAAFNHMTHHRSAFGTLRPISPMSLQVANGATLPVQGAGTASTGSVSLPDTLYVPQLVPNLVSVGKLTEDGCDVVFDYAGCVVQDRETGRVLGTGSKVGRSFILDDLRGRACMEPQGAWDGGGTSPTLGHQGKSGPQQACDGSKETCDEILSKENDFDAPVFSSNISVDSLWDLWHNRLGHPHDGRLKTMFSNNLLPDKLDLVKYAGDFSDCVSCLEAKASQSSFSSSDTVYDEPFDLVHSDLWGPSPVPDKLDLVKYAGDFSDCVSCLEAKASQSSFSSSDTVYDEPFDSVHSDLWGPSPVTSRLGYRYFALFIDHTTRFTWVYFLKQKSELTKVAKEFVQMVKTEFGKTIKVLRSDPGGEYTPNELLAFFKAEGILPQQSCPGVSQQNGVVERKNGHVLELTRAILFFSKVPTGFWVEAVHTIVYLINSQITPLLGQRSPYQALYSKLPDYSFLRIFGCTCFVLLQRKERHKLAPKVARCIFMGYSDKHKGYMCYDPVARRMRVAYHVKFLENHMHYHSSPTEASTAETLAFLQNWPSFETTPSIPLELTTDSSSTSSGTHGEPTSPTASGHGSPSSSSGSTSRDSSYGASSTSGSSSHSASSSPSSASSGSSSTATAQSTPPTPPVLPLRRSARSTLGRPPARMSDFISYSTEPIFVPRSYSQAVRDPRWNSAMRVEMDALEENHTWELVPRLDGMSVIGCRWVYTVKMLPDGAVDKFKARLVAQGFKQEYGIDYEETFAPVVKMQTVRSVFAVASMQGWPLLQLDVKNAFLHCDLKETIYMERPPGYDTGDSSMVCKLVRSLYGLKQAPRAWFEKFHSTLTQVGFAQSVNDPSLFTRNTVDGIVVLLVYVDDMIITGSDPDGIRDITAILRNAFNLKEMGEVSYFLGLEVHRSSQGLFVSQRKYILDLLDSAGFSDCVPCSTPMEQNLKLSRDQGEVMSDQSVYRSLVGSLIYLTHTRPNISYAVQVVSQYMGRATNLHLAAVHRLLRYLKQTQDVGMFFPAEGELTVEAFADADYAGCVDTRRSTSGWCIRVGNSFVSWRCRKQDKVSKSSTEAEYRSMSEVSSELVWIHRLLEELGVRC
ncbi:unnamed protein product [Linum trigynum]|uniref:Integrase catalytic domain-containing protein n=1 Tax=Linum trigynum TaxID=586398 RepID=A0AAV2CT79_9ROSI